ncbi:hypothetical protein E1B28_002545 [Marasmius oreades]|uniref:Uncharacterized protein n=1 Tax=Marasmius oreades TaxID=181124 RepID=A0A9P7ULW8_9AGAR|nr:uncharacterized protein E1B28_002545 [Marasmius oreades]KAG7086600.1 hypothetical protein E1B28_002545 [Marasmius oreades]
MADLPPRPTFEPPPDRPPRHLGPPGPDDRDRYPSSSYLPRGDHYESRRERESYHRDYDPRDRDHERDRVWNDRDRFPPRERSRFDEYDRRGPPPPPYRGSRDFDRRRSPPPRPSYDRDRDRDRPSYYRPRDRSPDRRDDWHRRRPLSPGPRYPDSYRHNSRSPPPRRRYSRSRSPPFRRTSSRSRSPPPPPKRLRLGNHSIGSPYSRSPSPRSRYRSPSPRRHQPPPYRDDRRRSLSPDRLSTRRHSRPPSRASRGSRRDSQVEFGEHVEGGRGSGSRTSEPVMERHRSRTRSPPRPSYQQRQLSISSPVSKGMVVDSGRQSPIPQSPLGTKNGDGDIQMIPTAPAETYERSPQFSSPRQPSPPREPRGAGELPRQPRMQMAQRGRGDFRGGSVGGVGRGVGGPFRGTGAEPPRGPRHRGPPTTSMINTTAAPSTSGGVNSQSPASAPYNGSAPTTPQIPSQAPTPVMEIVPYEQLLGEHSMYKQLKNAQTIIESQYKDKLNIEREYKNVYRATRRALHDFELSTIDLRASEVRRKATSAQLDLAREGALGIDYVGERNKVPVSV